MDKTKRVGILKKVLFIPLFLAVCLPIAGCGTNSSGNGGAPGFGSGPRYQEVQIALPTASSSVSFIVPDKNGAPDFYLMNNGPSENGEYLSIYRLENGLLEKRATPGWVFNRFGVGL